MEGMLLSLGEKYNAFFVVVFTPFLLFLLWSMLLSYKTFDCCVNLVQEALHKTGTLI